MSIVKYDQLVKMSIDELRKLNEDVIEVIKWKKSLIAKEMAKNISVGDKIKINHKKHLNKEYIVQKVNKKTVIGKEEGAYIEYSIPIHIVEKI